MSTGNNNKASGTRGKNSKQSADRSRQNKSRTGQNTRKNAAARVRRNTKRRRQPSYDYKMIAIIGVCLIFLITGVVFAVRHFTKQKTTPVTTAQTETELQKDVIVDGISLTGMSREKAKATLLKHYEWGMKVTYEGAETPYEIPNLMEGKVNALLEEIFMGKPQESYTLDTTGLEEAIAAEVKAIAKKWDVPARNGAISGFNKENGTFIYSGEQNGKILNQEQLRKDMTAALADKNFRSVLIAQGTVVAPEITEAQAKELYQVIGTKTTTTTANSDRNTNVQLAANALNGLIVQPGEEFSFNSTTGNRTLERGYKPAGAYVNGVLVEEPGGGVCQVSSTLYNAVVFAGLTTTERHAHSYEPSYITPGEDAMVSYDGYAGPDMRFVNNSKDAIAIRASFSDRKLTLSIVGIPILEAGEVWSMKSEKVAELDPPPPTYEENQTLEPGVEKVVKTEKKGSRWTTNLVKQKDGKVISDELFHKSTYKGKPSIIQRNTSGIVLTVPATVPVSVEVPVSESNMPPVPVETTNQDGSHEPLGPGVTAPAPTTAPPATQPQPTQSQPKAPGTTSPNVSSAPAPTTAPQGTQPQTAPPTPAETAGNIIAPNPY